MFEQETITSRQNQNILKAVALKDKSNRKKEGEFFFEGKKLFEEAVRRNVPICRIFLMEDTEVDPSLLCALPENCRIFRVTESVYMKLTEEKSPEGIFCVAKTIDKYHKFATIYKDGDFFPTLYKENEKKEVSLLFAVSLRDPGNLGTVIRSAAAFGFDGVILSEDCADIYSSKTVRATMGTLFDMPILSVADPEETVLALKKSGFSVYGSALDRTAIELPEIQPALKCCYIVGNEGHGLSESILEKCTARVFIPMSKKAESLNASVAAAILMYSRSEQVKQIKN